MTILDDIKRLQDEGRSDQEIIEMLQQQGYAQKDIAEMLAQARIKEAVTDSDALQSQSNESSGQDSGAQYSQYQQPAAQGQQYEQYESYSSALSTDTMAEIAEQVVMEKLSPLRDQLEAIINLKTSLEAKIEYLDERVKRIEKIIDRLQLSILQKVGEYVSNVSDVKRDLEETQKSFKAMAEHHRK